MGILFMPHDATRASLELLYNISRELSTAIDLRTVLDRVLFLSTGNVSAERGSLIILDEHLKPIDAAIVYNNQLIENIATQMQFSLDQGLAGWVVRTRQSVLISDTSKDSRWMRRPDDDIKASGPKSTICIPLLAQNNVVGVLTIVHPEPNFFTNEHLALLQSIADQAGIAVYNARLYESLQVAHRRYRELFEDSINPIVISDETGKVVMVNRQACRFFGCERVEMQERNIYDLHEARPELLGQRLDNVQNGTTVTYESMITNAQGESTPVQVYIRQVIIEGEDYLQWIFQDITERKALDSMRNDLIAMIYHDLRSPLANIISSLDMLEVIISPENAAGVKSVLSIASRSTDRMQRLINSLLDIHRLEAGNPIITQSAVDIVKLAEEAIEVVQPLAEGKQQTLESHLPANLPAVWVDQDMVRRILINLLENANKFTPMQGHVRLGGMRDGDMVRLWVQDTGQGIPREAQDQIFEKFTRLQAERFPKGLGLGLAFCRLAVQAHGGNIWVESQEGKGSRFMFTLPVASSDMTA
jgi:NtrC-family two-component system sensor histidine kinase KinB